MAIDETKHAKLASIQLLRAAAAIAVVFTHAITRLGYSFPDTASHLHLTGPNGQILAGDAGVDVFFVISGFIMYFVHHNDFGVPGASLKFLEKRILRIVPIYWLLTTLAVAAILAVPNLRVTHDSGIRLSELASSYLFLPIASRGPTISPIIGVGWTLDYEMFFYLTFAGALFLPLRRGLLVIGVLFVSAVGIGAIINPAGATARFFSDWLLLDFLMGVGIGWWAVSVGDMPAALRWCLILLALACLALTLIWAPPEHGPLRFLCWGVPAALLVLGACSADVPANKLTDVGVTLGDASYSIYLFQFFALPATAFLMRRAGLGGVSFDLNVLILTGIVTVAGVGCWWFVERPLAKGLRRWKFGRQQRQANGAVVLNAAAVSGSRPPSPE
jgi:exopolysaccharide production protein ExoZ